MFTIVNRYDEKYIPKRSDMVPTYLILNKTDYNINKRLLLRRIHHFKTDLINTMDNLRISGTEPSSVILSKKKGFSKVEKRCPKRAKNKRKPKGMV